MRSYIKILIIFIFVIPAQSYSQNYLSNQKKEKSKSPFELTEDYFFWINAGLGAFDFTENPDNVHSSEDFHASVAANAGVYFSPDNKYLIGMSSHVVAPFSLFKDLKINQIDGINLVAGKVISERWRHHSIAAGISYLRIRMDKDRIGDFGQEFSEEVEKNCFGLCVESQISIVPFPGFGGGLYFFGNLNKEANFFGINLNIIISTSSN